MGPLRRRLIATLSATLCMATPLFAEDAVFLPDRVTSEALSRLTTYLFAEVENGTSAPILTASSQNTGIANFGTELAQFWERARNQGVDFLSLEVMSVDWARNPEGPPPGLYAKVHVTTPTNAAHFACGHVLWREEGNTFKIIGTSLAEVAPHHFANEPFETFQKWTQDKDCVGFNRPQGVQPPEEN